MTECQECLTLLNPQQQIMLSVMREGRGREGGKEGRERKREKQRDKRGKKES